jgi:exo-beta-1,3-glucanase (GH17 family)
MSFRPSHFQKVNLAKLDKKPSFSLDKTEEDLRCLFWEILHGGIHGLCFSLYEDGQKPGDIISADQIRRRLAILSPYTQWVRSFSCIEGNELIPVIAREFGMKTLVGAWLGEDEEKNREEIEGLIQLGKEGYLDVAAVGNEVLYRNDLPKEQLLDLIAHVKAELPGIPVGYVDAYYEFTQHQDLSDACDVILCNCYPFWEGTPFEYALQHMQHMYAQAKSAAKGKKVIITETGWPSQGQALGGAIPSGTSAMQYFINTQLWALDEDIEVFYFASFDESWKVGAEGDVGAYWGIWDKHEQLKYGLKPEG